MLTIYSLLNVIMHHSSTRTAAATSLNSTWRPRNEMEVQEQTCPIAQTLSHVPVHIQQETRPLQSDEQPSYDSGRGRIQKPTLENLRREIQMVGRLGIDRPCAGFLCNHRYTQQRTASFVRTVQDGIIAIGLIAIENAHRHSLEPCFCSFCCYWCGQDILPCSMQPHMSSGSANEHAVAHHSYGCGVH